MIDPKQEYPEAVFRVGIYGHMGGLAPEQIFGPDADDIVDDVRPEAMSDGVDALIKDLGSEEER